MDPVGPATPLMKTSPVATKQGCKARLEDSMDLLNILVPNMAFASDTSDMSQGDADNCLGREGPSFPI